MCWRFEGSAESGRANILSARGGSNRPSRKSVPRMDAMRANRAQALAGAYNTGGFICSASGSASLAAADTTAWINGWRTALGLDAADAASGCGSISCDAGTGVCDVGLRWDESRTTDAAAGQKVAGSTTRTFWTKVQL